MPVQRPEAPKLIGYHVLKDTKSIYVDRTLFTINRDQGWQMPTLLKHYICVFTVHSNIFAIIYCSEFHMDQHSCLCQPLRGYIDTTEQCPNLHLYMTADTLSKGFPKASFALTTFAWISQVYFCIGIVSLWFSVIRLISGLPTIQRLITDGSSVNLIISTISFYQGTILFISNVCKHFHR